MVVVSLLLHAGSFRCAAVLFGWLARRSGASERGAVAIAFGAASVLHCTLLVSYYAFDDMLHALDVAQLPLWLAAVGAPSLALDVWRMRQARDPHPAIASRARRALAGLALAPPSAMLAIVIAHRLWLHPAMSERVVAAAERTREHTDVCDPPEYCDEVVDRFVARVRRGDITLRALFIAEYHASVAEEVGLMDDEGAVTMFHYFEAVEQYDGQPPPLEEYLEP